MTSHRKPPLLSRTEQLAWTVVFLVAMVATIVIGEWAW